MTATTSPSVPAATGDEATHLRVVVVGAGLAGIAAAVKLKQAGLTDYVVLEKADRVGGTWRENTYPGCGCDIPAPVYSFSLNPKPQWRKNFALQPEIVAYINDTVDKFALQPKIRLSTELIDARGRKFAAWPFSTGLLRRRLSRFDLQNYHAVPATDSADIPAVATSA